MQPKPSRKPACVNLDQDLLIILRGFPLQITNVSDVINSFLLDLASEEEELTPSQIKAKVWQIAQQKRKEILEQHKTAVESKKAERLPDPKVRCYDAEDEVYRLVLMSEIREFPERFQIDEKIGGLI